MGAATHSSPTPSPSHPQTTAAQAPTAATPVVPSAKANVYQAQTAVHTPPISQKVHLARAHRKTAGAGEVHSPGSTSVQDPQALDSKHTTKAHGQAAEAAQR